MKLRYLLILFVAFLIGNATYADDYVPTNPSGPINHLPGGFIEQLTEDYPLIMKGEFSDAGTRSVHPASPIDAAIANQILYIEFAAAVGELEITVKKGNQTYYSANVDVTNVGQLISIPLDNYQSGAYVLELGNSRGGYVYGEFIVE